MEDEEIPKIISAYIKESASDVFVFSASVTKNSADTFVDKLCQKTTKRSTATVFLTTYGGDPDAAYRMARALRREYKMVRVLVAGFCKSAGTLVALAANELGFSEYGEIGPLDTQISKPDEILSRHSGLDIVQSMDSITESTLESFEKHMLRIIRASGGAISTKVAADIAIQLSSGIFAPISAQIDPVRLGSARRAIDIARAYGSRLARMSQNLKPGSLDRLIDDYPTHGFVIDVEEAKELFNNVKEFNASEAKIFQMFRQVLRIQGEELIVDLEEVFPEHEDQTDEEAQSSISTHADTTAADHLPGEHPSEPERGDGRSEDSVGTDPAKPIRSARPNGKAQASA